MSAARRCGIAVWWACCGDASAMTLDMLTHLHLARRCIVKTDARMPRTRTAVNLADEGGIAALTMRRLAHVPAVEAVPLYRHVADKDEVLDGMVDVVVS